jgi:putative phosphoserine phosphatase/1-acylglycerol-3-phosphate O-acyltransferase
MSAGIPVVPIVIRNAEVIAARNSTTINPGTVDVAVFPPIPVDDWTVDTLPDRIDEVRQLYLDTLADWPVDELPKSDLYNRKPKASPSKPRRRPRKAQPKTAAKKASPASSRQAAAAPARKARPKGRP